MIATTAIAASVTATKVMPLRVYLFTSSSRVYGRLTSKLTGAVTRPVQRQTV